MATLLSPRDEFPADNIKTLSEAATRGLNGAGTASTPFSVAEITGVPLLEAVPVAGTRFLSLAGRDRSSEPSPSVVRGVSLSGVLQMLHLERKTCVLEVVSSVRFGTLTLVNGELVDADVDGTEGEEAVYDILAWPHPQTTILDGVSLFRHTVDQPIAQLLVESVRRQDEAGGEPELDPLQASPFPPVFHTRDLSAPDTAARLSDWKWLVETLVISGARLAAVVRARDEHVLALANEFGGLVRTPSTTDLEELAPVARSVRRWSRLVHPTVDEIVVRTGDRRILVCPVDSERQVFAYALNDGGESFELARSAIRSIQR